MEIITYSNNDLKMKYLRFGNPEGKAFVVLPGLSLKSVMGLAQFVVNGYKIFTEDYDVYLFDRREDMPDRYDVYDMARDTASVIKDLGLKDITLMGFSQGGMMAQVIAIEEKELVKKLVLGSTTPRVRDTEKGTIGEWITLAEEGKIDELIDAFASVVYSDDYYTKYKDAIHMGNRDATAEDLRRFVILGKGTDGFDVSGSLDQITAKTLVLASASDRIIDKAAFDDLDAIKDLTKYRYEGYSHAVYDEAPDYFERVIGFMNSNG